MSSITVYADNEGIIDITIDVDEELKGTIEFTLKNIQTGNAYTFSLSHTNNYRGRCSVKLGNYEVIDYKIYDKNNTLVTGIFYLEDFEVSSTNLDKNNTMYLMPVVILYTDNNIDAYGTIKVDADVDDELQGTVEFTLKNMLTGTLYSFSLSHANGYKGSCTVQFGKYEIVDYRIFDKNRKKVDGTVYLDNFEVGLENPNENWTWYLYPIVTYVADEEVTTTKKVTEKESDTTNIYDILNNLGKEDNEKETTDTLVIPADNPYFPNMTLDEIKIWYIREVNAFISSGGTTKSGWTYELEDYQKSLKYWADDTFDKDKYGMQIEYRGSVEAYDTDETRHFYEVQKKMYDFIKEYQEENNVYLNFINWDIAVEKESTSTIPTSNHTSSFEPETTSTSEKFSSPEETTTVYISEPSTVDDNSSNSKTFVIILSIACSLALATLVISYIIFKQKKKEKN